MVVDTSDTGEWSFDRVTCLWGTKGDRAGQLVKFVKRRETKFVAAEALDVEQETKNIHRQRRMK